MPPPPPTPPPPLATVGAYRLAEPLRLGGVSSVYRAVSTVSGQTVAIKLLSPQVLANPAAVERFHRAAEDAARLSHPNVLGVIETGQEGDRPYVVTEYYDGQPLERLLAEGRLPIARAFGIFRGICQGLEHAHRHGLLHLHLQPRNVLVGEGPTEIKIADFGPSENEALAPLGPSLTTGALDVSAFHYLAPEQVRSPGGAAPAPPDARADLYSAGVLLHQMLTGRAPGGRFALPSQQNPDLPPVCDALVLKCLARGREERHADATALLADLVQVEEALSLRVLTQLRGLSSRKLGCLSRAGAALLILLLPAAAAFVGASGQGVAGEPRKGSCSTPAIRRNADFVEFWIASDPGEHHRSETRGSWVRTRGDRTGRGRELAANPVVLTSGSATIRGETGTCCSRTLTN